VNAVYAITHETALRTDFGLCGQIQRAAVSAMSNVAEGFERQHFAEKVQAYNVARASCGEVRSLLYVIEDNYPRSAAAAILGRKLVGEAGSLISGLLASTRRRLTAKARRRIGIDPTSRVDRSPLFGLKPVTNIEDWRLKFAAIF